ncbi:MAG: DUF2281 domain-containing protein [Proteobacteria bacterium]|nr:DUF2281 domain-containing protein [Pseudomonadota bacterium]
MEKTLDISRLPKNAQIEISDFFEFLYEKSTENSKKAKKTVGGKIRFARFVEIPVSIGQLKSYTREELHER